MKKYIICLSVTVLMLASSKLFAKAVQTSPKEFDKKGKRGVELIDKIGKRYFEVAFDPEKLKTQSPYPTMEEIKELKSLTPYLPKKGAIKNKDYTELIQQLEKLPNSALESPKNDQEKAAQAKYSKPNLQLEDVKNVNSVPVKAK